MWPNVLRGDDKGSIYSDESILRKLFHDAAYVAYVAFDDQSFILLHMDSDIIFKDFYV